MSRLTEETNVMVKKTGTKMLLHSKEQQETATDISFINTN